MRFRVVTCEDSQSPTGKRAVVVRPRGWGRVGGARGRAASIIEDEKLEFMNLLYLRKKDRMF